MGTSLLATKGFAAPEPGASLPAGASAVSPDWGNRHSFSRCWRGCVSSTRCMERLQTAGSWQNNLLRLAESTGDPGLILEAHYGLGCPFDLAR